MPEPTDPSATTLSLKGLVADIRSEAPIFLVIFVSVIALIAGYYGSTMPVGVYSLVPEGAAPLAPYAWWSGVYLLAWFAFPLVVAIRSGFGPASCGLTVRTLIPKLWIFGFIYVASFVFIVVAAAQPQFTDTYPFLRADQTPVWSWRLLIGFWLVYAVQLFATEFFFRGFMIFMLKPRLGYGAIAVMVVPYVMIHFDKPLPETIGAVAGGTLLGWLAFKTNSIWGGVILHIAVALTMDSMAMLQNGTGFPVVW